MHKPQLSFAIAAMAALRGMFTGNDGVVAANYQQGPGKKTIFTVHKGIGEGKYMPHQNVQECDRRLGKTGMRHPSYGLKKGEVYDE